MLRWVDDLSVKAPERPPFLQDIINLCLFLGLPLAEEKSANFHRQNMFFGFVWALDAELVSLPAKTQIKYTARLVHALSSDTRLNAFEVTTDGPLHMSYMYICQAKHHARNKFWALAPVNASS